MAYRSIYVIPFLQSGCHFSEVGMLSHTLGTRSFLYTLKTIPVGTQAEL